MESLEAMAFRSFAHRFVLRRQTAWRSGSCGPFDRSAFDWLLIMNHQHLAHVLHVFIDHYNSHRPHRAPSRNPPCPRIQPSPKWGSARVRRRDRLGGLIREYTVAA
jgi:putative transposase